MKKDTVTRPVQDLGVAAYILMHSHPLSGRKDKTFLFNIEKEKLKEFEDLKTSYLFSEFHYFDHCLMGLKKLDEYPYPISSSKYVTDLGAAAFLLMHKFKVVGKKGRSFYFEIHSQEEELQFDETNFQYTASEFHDFDSKLMSLKKIGEFSRPSNP
jgi:hypothetical protein